MEKAVMTEKLELLAKWGGSSPRMPISGKFIRDVYGLRNEDGNLVSSFLGKSQTQWAAEMLNADLASHNAIARYDGPNDAFFIDYNVTTSK
jgi:hypothetical protein